MSAQETTISALRVLEVPTAPPPSEPYYFLAMPTPVSLPIVNTSCGSPVAAPPPTSSTPSQTSALPPRTLVAAAPRFARYPSSHAAGRFFPTRQPASPLLSWRNLCKLLVAGVWLRGGAISRLQPLAKPHLYSARDLYTGWEWRAQL